MKNISTSDRVFFLLVIILAISAALTVLLTDYTAIPGSGEGFELPASKPVLALANAGIILVIYGALGFLGLRLSLKLGFAEILDEKVSNRQRYAIPLLIGFICAVIFILADIIFADLHGLGRIPHPPFPGSIFASLTAGIGEEILFRLFFISFWTWLISSVILKGKGKEPVFWIVTIFSAIAFGAAHLPGVSMVMDVVNFPNMPVLLILEILLLNFIISIPCAVLMRKFGFLAAVGIHFWTDIFWHVVWGLLQ